MNIRTGVDIEQVARFERLLQKPSFMRGVYTEGERAYIEQKPHPAQTAAGLFCAKEAAAKALGRGLFGLRPNQIEVVWNENGAPALRLYGAAAECGKNCRFSVSIAHSGGMAVAFCVAAETEGA